MFFERPQALALLLLALPWIAWLRRQQPRAFPVGGLDPFRPYARAGGAQRRGWPWALICALAALACAALALAEPGFGSRPRYLVVDRSASVRVRGLPEPAAAGRIVLPCETGLLAVLQGLPPNARAEVWTDLPPPAGLPGRIQWNDEAFHAFMEPNAAILVARPLARNRWLVHWLRESGAGPLWLVSDTGEQVPLTAGEEGLTEIEVSGTAARLTLRRADGGAPDARADQDWSLSALVWTISDLWDPRWEAVAEAAWPGIQLRRAPHVAEPLFDSDPLAALADLEAVAFLAGELRAAADRAQAPRPASECRTHHAPGRWQEIAGPSPAPPGRISGWLGAAGAAFLLLSFLTPVLRSRRTWSAGRANP